jgi:hypothetical protein
MTDWQAVASALHAPIQPEDHASAIVPLEKLERAFRPLQENIPLDTPLWGGQSWPQPASGAESQDWPRAADR